MSAESDYKCPKCGKEWCAIPPTECPQCSTQPFQRRAQLKTGIQSGLSRTEYQRQYRKINRHRINQNWQKWWHENVYLNPSRKGLAAACRIAATLTQNTALKNDLADAATVLEYLETRPSDNLSE